MHRQRWIVVLAILAAGTVMALDSGAMNAPPGVLGLAALALLVPAAAGLLSGNLRIHGAAAVLSSAILLVARLLSGVELRWYAIPWILFVLLVGNWAYENRRLAAGPERPDGLS